MIKKLSENARPLTFAILVHAVLIALLIVGLDWTPKLTPQAGNKVDVVQAAVVDETKVQTEMRRKKEEDQRKKQQEVEQQKKLDEQAQQAEAARLEQIRREQTMESTRLEQLKQEQQAEAARLEQTRQERIATEQQHQEEDRRINELKDKQRLETEQQRAAEDKHLAEVEAQRKIETEKKRQAEAEAQARNEAEDQLRKQVEAEEVAEDAEAREQAVKSELGRYTALIKQKVTRNWLRPPSARPGMSCTVRVSLEPGGGVLDARVVASSGDSVFDRSVERAVLRASPLPLPTDPAVFQFLNGELDFIFTP